MTNDCGRGGRGGRRSHPVSVEHVGQLVGAQLQVGFAVWPRPAHPHVSARHRLELKVPLAGAHSVGALHPEEADLVDGQPLHHVPCSGQGGGDTGQDNNKPVES